MKPYFDDKIKVHTAPSGTQHVDVLDHGRTQEEVDEFYNSLVRSQKDLHPDIADLIYKNLWELY